MLGVSLHDLTPWLVATSMTVAKTGVRLVLIVGLGYLAVRLMTLGIRHLETILIKAGVSTEPHPGAAHKRVSTLTGVVRTIARSLIWAIVIIQALDQVGLDIRPILAGAGIIGLAVGFGAQNLIRDLISGFFLILENQVRLGDVVVINGTGGQVEAITFRTIVLRDLSGVVHVFPNGLITTLSNMTMEWSAFVLDMGIAYKEDTDRVTEIMRSVAEELRNDPAFGPKIIEPMEVFGVDNFADSAVIIKARIKTKPLEQWNVGREYRRRLKKAFEAHGIEIPFPHHTFHIEGISEPFQVRILEDADAGHA
ncbi:MAG TPA: mechanosensitive ion channel family protein [Nitrospiraceae bacterium]|nr:mechanosensitive ion channel family protein [Nitrospiraceae bacterium]